jgi:E3 ubiquitin-protein ligase NRDP1
MSNLQFRARGASTGDEFYFSIHKTEYLLNSSNQVISCEHAFCTGCIQEWLSRQPTCPVDRQPITTANLRSVPRILRNLLSRLSISCDNQLYGCTQVLKLDALQSHLEECEHNPKRPLPCENGCGEFLALKFERTYRKFPSRLHHPRRRAKGSQLCP